MKLHKLAYFVQAGSLAFFDVAAFNEPIEAWKYGPMVRTMAGHYMQFEGNPIPGPVAGSSGNLDERTSWIVDRVLAEYGDLTGPELAKLTKGPGSPWRQVRGDLPPEEPSDLEIPQPLIGDFHRTHGVFPADPTPEENALAQRFFDGDDEALADLTERVTGIRATVR